MLPRMSCGDIEKWWEIMALSDDIEGYLVRLWLLRHNKLEISSLGKYDEIYDKVKLVISDLPEFMKNRVMN